MSEYGEVVVSRQYDHEIGRDRIHIDRADPKAWISLELFTEIRDICPRGATCTEDGVLTLADDYGQRFIYRVDLDAYDPETESFPMEWPD